MDFITVGQVLRASGIRGEIKVKPLTDSPQRFFKLKTVYIDGLPFGISEKREDGGFIYLYLTGVSTRDEAEKLKDKFIQIDRVNAVPLDENRFFISDIIGSELVFEDGEKFGIIEDVGQYGAADVFTAADSNGKKAYFPFIKKILINVDTDKKRITVDKSEFLKVCVYDD